MSWFSLRGIMTEIKRIRWPKSKEMLADTTTVVVFTVLFGIYFVGVEFVVAFLLRIIGVGK